MTQKTYQQDPQEIAAELAARTKALGYYFKISELFSQIEICISKGQMKEQRLLRRKVNRALSDLDPLSIVFLVELSREETTSRWIASFERISRTKLALQVQLLDSVEEKRAMIEQQKKEGRNSIGMLPFEDE